MSIIGRRYYAESDGGPTWVGHYWSHQPKTYYVVDCDGLKGPLECDSLPEARKLADRLNRKAVPSE